MRLNTKQLDALSQFFGTVAAAWFTASVISPFFLAVNGQFIAISFFFYGIFMTIVFIGLALVLLIQ